MIKKSSEPMGFLSVTLFLTVQATDKKKHVGSHDTFNSVTTKKTQGLRWKIKKNENDVNLIKPLYIHVNTPWPCGWSLACSVSSTTCSVTSPTWSPLTCPLNSCTRPSSPSGPSRAASAPLASSSSCCSATSSSAVWCHRWRPRTGREKGALSSPHSFSFHRKVTHGLEYIYICYTHEIFFPEYANKLRIRTQIILSQTLIY